MYLRLAIPFKLLNMLKLAAYIWYHIVDWLISKSHQPRYEPPLGLPVCNKTYNKYIHLL